MKTNIEEVITKIASDVKDGNYAPHETQQLAQAALSFGHILVMLKETERNR
jgi:hypothetical protein